MEIKTHVNTNVIVEAYCVCKRSNLYPKIGRLNKKKKQNNNVYKNSLVCATSRSQRKEVYLVLRTHVNGKKELLIRETDMRGYHREWKWHAGYDPAFRLQFGHNGGIRCPFICVQAW